MLTGVGVPGGWKSPCFSNAQRMTLLYAPPKRPSVVQLSEIDGHQRVGEARARSPGSWPGVSVLTARRMR